MILRLLRAGVPDGAGPALLTRLREEVVPATRRIAGLATFTYGIRHEAGQTQFLALSSWRDFSDIVAASDGELDRPVRPVRLDDILTDIRTEHFELIEPASEGVVTLDGALLGVVSATVRMNAESAVHNMIRGVRPEVEAAGVIGLHVGRRVDGSTTELVVLALWRDRTSLRRFAEGRSRGLLDPAFLDQLNHWSFETYDCLSPERLLLPPSGPAVLLINDERRYVDVSSGIEAVLGIPGEFLLHRTIDELLPPEDQAAIDTAWASFLAAGAQDGETDVIRPDGVRVRVRYRAQARHPEPGLHASVLSLPRMPADPRPVDQIVAEAFATSPAG